MKRLISSGVIFADTDNTMEQVARLMRDHCVSCVLVSSARSVVGIITERDIVQKFTLLSMEDKLNAKAGAFMSRPVQFANLETMEQDMRLMLVEGKMRHFPISTAGSRNVDDIIGLITVTDIARNYLIHYGVGQAPAERRDIVILAGSKPYAKHYKSLFEALGYFTILEGEPTYLIAYAETNALPLICDLDYLPMEEARTQLRLLKSFNGTFILLSSEDKLVDQLAPLMNSPNHFVSRKPLDMTLVLKFLGQNRKT